MKNNEIKMPDVKWEKITPEIASVYLQVNTGNRILRKYHVKSIANDIKNGNFEITGQSIVFDSDGKLVDGQHRLSAIIESNCAVNMLVVRGVKVGTHNIDVGLKRTMRDVATMFNSNDCLLKDSNTTSAAILLANIANNKKSKVTNDEAFSLIQKYRDSFEYTYKNIQCKATKTIRGIRTASIVAAITVLHNKLKNDTSNLDRFVSVLVSGFMDSDEDKQVIVLRNWIISRNGSNNYSDRVKVFKAVLLAYKKFTENENLTASALSRNDKIVYDIEI